MTSEGLGEMFEGDSADTCAGKFPLVSMGGRAEGLLCTDLERGPTLAIAKISDQFFSPFQTILSTFCNVFYSPNSIFCDLTPWQFLTLGHSLVALGTQWPWTLGY